MTSQIAAHRVIWLHRSAPPKPAVGRPCNGCGVCCSMAPCPVGILVSLRTAGACRALRWDANTTRYVCGVVSWPQRHARSRLGWLARAMSAWARRIIAAGQGCDCSDEAVRQPS